MPIINLLNTPAERVLDSFFEILAQGNGGMAEIEDLFFDTGMGVLPFRARILHRHRILPMERPLFNDVSRLEGEFNSFLQNAGDVTFCTESPIGRICSPLGLTVVKALRRLLSPSPAMQPGGQPGWYPSPARSFY